MYATYLSEKTDILIIENEKGFATYRYLPNDQCYIMDIFILPEYRKQYIATEFADSITEEAKKVNTTRLIGSVIPSNKDSEKSILVLLHYGMKLLSCNENIIYFYKDI